MDFPKALQQCRRERRLTQDEIAEKIGITRQAYSAYELGKRKPDISRAYELAKAIGITLEELLHLAEHY